MTKIEKQMIVAVVVLLALLTLSFYQMNKALQPIAANVEKNGIKPYVMQFWEGKKN
jgi:hypothetical protein